MGAADAADRPPPVAHGALDHAALAGLGLRAADLLDFSSNLNPFGPPAGVRAALAALDPAPYPDRSCHRLRVALAARHGCAPDEVLAGNGANELIHLVARALLAPGDVTLVAAPTFGEYAHAGHISGAMVVEQRAGERFEHSAESLAAVVAGLRPRLTWLCAPNNPTGTTLDDDAILALARACAAVGGHLVLDRAYHPFLRAGQRDTLPAGATGLLLLHSLTKSYAMAGLRSGYLLGGAETLARVASYQPTWSVSSAAQAASLAALDDAAFLPDTLPRLWEAADALHADLSALGLSAWRATLPFMLVRVGDAAATRAALLAHGCVVRDCTSFGLPAWVRVAPRRPEENRRLVAAWRAVLAGSAG